MNILLELSILTDVYVCRMLKNFESLFLPFSTILDSITVERRWNLSSKLHPKTVARVVKAWMKEFSVWLIDCLFVVVLNIIQFSVQFRDSALSVLVLDTAKRLCWVDLSLVDFEEVKPSPKTLRWFGFIWISWRKNVAVFAFVSMQMILLRCIGTKMNRRIMNVDKKRKHAIMIMPIALVGLAYRMSF